MAWVFSEQKVASVGVAALAGSVTANCYFHGGDLALDVDPREVTGKAAFESVLNIMRFIANALGLPVFAVAEGSTPA